MSKKIKCRCCGKTITDSTSNGVKIYCSDACRTKYNRGNCSLQNFKGGEMKIDEKYKDGIVGRPIKLNIKELEVRPNKKYSEVIFCGDWHYGARECDVDRIKRMLDYCLKTKTYIFLMGDLIESGLKNSVGASVYRQIHNPQKQMEKVISFLEPLAEKKLILGILEGNHERRIEKETGISITKIISNFLHVPYLRSACWNLWKVGKESYTIYALHGSSGSRFIYTKLKALVDISHSFNADLMAMGHVHEIDDDSQIVQEVDKTRKIVIENKKFLILTGHYLRYDNSYVQEKGYPISKMGSPKIKFFSEKHDIHTSM